MTGRRPLDSGSTMPEDAPLFSALIVDDNFALREAIARSLARDAWDVTTAPDGLEGLEAVRNYQFDVVITDVHMPGRGGLWLWKEALALRPELRGKFVFMSSEPLPEPPSGEVFMVKPLSLAALQSEVQSIVRRAEGAKFLAREIAHARALIRTRAVVGSNPTGGSSAAQPHSPA